MDKNRYAVQLITDDGKWPQIGTASINKNGSINVYLQPGVGVGVGQKLYLRPMKAKAEAKAGTAAEVG